jgi:3-phosphoshikimate 1-carboxyvinyltransferase
MIEIRAGGIRKHTALSVPGSKSYTHRMLIAAGLSNGVCRLTNCLDSEDTRLTLEALRQWGVRTELSGERLMLHGVAGRPRASLSPVFLGNSGTSMRLLVAVASLGSGCYRFTGSDRMQERPIQDLLDALVQLGVSARSIKGNGCPPLEVVGDGIRGGRVSINCGTSSQFLSGLLLTGPCTRDGLEISVLEGPVSRPYVDMTVGVLDTFGIRVERDGYGWFRVPGGQVYRAGAYTIEPDGSQAGYFWAAAAVTGASVKVRGILAESRQGDVNFAGVLERMGATVERTGDGITVTGGDLTGIEADLGDMPDMVPTLAVVAAFAEGTTRIRNVAHLKVKESDRLGSVARELGKMGVHAVEDGQSLVIRGGRPHGAEIDPHDDHRLAMSFAVAGLRVPGIRIRNEICVAKSFPNFWEVFGKLYES